MARVAVPQTAEANPLGFVLGHYAPAIGAAGAAFAGAVYQSSDLPLRVLEAARLRIAQLNGCLICQEMRAAEHVDPLLAGGGGDPARSVVARGGAAPDEAFYAAVADWRGAALFSERERLALDHAERFATDPQGFAGDESYWARLHTAFSDQEIVDLTLCIAAWLALGRVTHVLELDTVCIADMVAV